VGAKTAARIREVVGSDYAFEERADDGAPGDDADGSDTDSTDDTDE
jgi:hypothetical protein